MEIEQAILILSNQVIPTLGLYKVGTAQESSVLPMALALSAPELRAIACLVESARLSAKRSETQAALMNEAADKMDELRRERDAALAKAKELEERMDEIEDEHYHAGIERDLLT